MPRPIDWALAGAAAIVALGVLAFPIVGSQFRAMYGDFGSEVPVFTQLAVSAWFPPVLGLGLFAVIGAGLALGPKIGGRAPWIAGALAAAILAIPGLCVAVYYPLFGLSATLR